jgi:hypothetical protein
MTDSTHYTKYIKGRRNNEKYNEYMKNYYYKKRGIENTPEAIQEHKMKRKIERVMKKTIELFKEYDYKVYFEKINNN